MTNSGFHHACSNTGGGFCIYADISLIVAHMRKIRPKLRVMIIDLDAHQGSCSRYICFFFVIFL